MGLWKTALATRIALHRFSNSNHPFMHAPSSIAKTLGSWLLLAFALLLSSTAWAQRDEGPYQILQAVYGTDQYSIDVTDRLRQLARRDQRFQLTNDLFGADPAPGRRKTLRIHARGPDGRPQTFDFGEYSWVDGAQFAGWRSGRWGRGYDNDDRQGRNDDQGRYGYADRGDVSILQATYGTPQSRFDVTPQIRQLLRGDQRFQLTNQLFNGDPAPGQRKTLQIVLGGLGNQPETLEYGEGSWIDAARIAQARTHLWEQRGGRNDANQGYVNIQRALYGNGYRQVDITARLRSMVQGGRLEVAVDNDLAGADPAPGERKSLTVEFSLGRGPVQQTTAREGQWLQLP